MLPIGAPGINPAHVDSADPTPRTPRGGLLPRCRARLRDLRRRARAARRGRLRPDEHGRRGRAGQGQQGDHLPALARQAGARARRRPVPRRPALVVPAGHRQPARRHRRDAARHRPTASAAEDADADGRRPAGHAQRPRARRLRAHPGDREQVRHQPHARGAGPSRAASCRPTTDPGCPARGRRRPLCSSASSLSAPPSTMTSSTHVADDVLVPLLVRSGRVHRLTGDTSDQPLHTRRRRPSAAATGPPDRAATRGAGSRSPCSPPPS